MSKIQYKTKEKLLEEYSKNYKKIGFKEGSHNEVYIFQDSITGKKIAIRIAKEATFKILNRTGPRTGKIEKIDPKLSIKKIETSRKNWILASEKELSPELISYDYISKGIKNDVEELFLCIVSEAYDSDLENFYNKKDGYFIKENFPDKLTSVDIKIQKQLTDLLNEISKKPFYTICFDIKPMNSVIKKISKDQFSVKLIDWDADFCKSYKDTLKVSDREYLAGLLSNIIMANQFYTYINRNIFADYFKEINKDMDISKESLKELFCDEAKYDYKYIADHYFQLKKNEYESLECSDLFDILYERAFIIKPYGNPFDKKTRGGRKKKTNKNLLKRKSQKKSKKVKKFKKVKKSKKK